MSVPVWQRNLKDKEQGKENYLDLFMESRNFAIYILKITANEKIFLPIFQKSITDRLNQLAVDIHNNLWKANNVKLNTQNKNERYRLQLLTLENIVDFLAIWDIASKAFHLRSNRTSNVVGKLLNMREATKRWINNDIARLKSDNIENNAV